MRHTIAILLLTVVLAASLLVAAYFTHRELLIHPTGKSNTPSESSPRSAGEDMPARPSDISTPRECTMPTQSAPGGDATASSRAETDGLHSLLANLEKTIIEQDSDSLGSALVETREWDFPPEVLIAEYQFAESSVRRVILFLLIAHRADDFPVAQRWLEENLNDSFVEMLSLAPVLGEAFQTIAMWTGWTGSHLYLTFGRALPIIKERCDPDGSCDISVDAFPSLRPWTCISYSFIPRVSISEGNPMAYFSCCHVGKFYVPDRDCLAEEFLEGARTPVAVLASPEISAWFKSG